MLKTNTYFEGNVVSISLENEDGVATIGVMAPGEYKFSTSKKEYMKIISGSMQVRLPDESEFRKYSKDELFVIEAGKEFEVKLEEETAYTCVFK